jgi:hypothetical protein
MFPMRRAAWMCENVAGLTWVKNEFCHLLVCDKFDTVFYLRDVR